MKVLRTEGYKSQIIYIYPTYTDADIQYDSAKTWLTPDMGAYESAQHS